MNLKEIKELMELMKQMGVSELEVERSGVKIRIRKGPPPVVEPTVSIPYPAGVLPEELATGATRRTGGPVSAPGATGAEADRGVLVQSPIVGTFFRGASPDGPNYVEVGDHVKKGQILCIVEAMKLMNEIESEVDGRVLDILVENARPVEYGQALFRVEPTSGS